MASPGPSTVSRQVPYLEVINAYARDQNPAGLGISGRNRHDVSVAEK